MVQGLQEAYSQHESAPGDISFQSLVRLRLVQILNKIRRESEDAQELRKPTSDSKCFLINFPLL